MPVGTTNFPTSLDDATSLVEVKNNASTTLTSAINASVLSIPIADPSEFPESGFATIVDDLDAPTKIEIITYTSKSGSNLVVPSGGRGQQGTTANSFSSGHYVELRPTAGHHEALRGAIIAAETKLGAGADTPASGEVLIGTGTGASGWRALLAADLPTGIDAAKIGGGAVSNTEFGYLDGVTSAIQTQLDGKAASSHTHAASDITSGQLALARGGTGADLSATGAGFLKQATTGAAVTVTALSSGDIPDLSGTYATAGHNHAGTYQPLDSDLTAVAGLASTGIIARTGSGTASVRTITGITNRVTVTNGDGVSGNPTLDIGTDVVTLTGTQTLTNKTLTAPTINGGTHTALTSLGVRSTGTGAFDLTIANSENLTAGRTLTITTGDAARTLTLSGNATISGTNTGDQTITLSGDVSGSGTSGIAATIASNAVTNAKLATVATQTFKGRTTAGTGNVEDLTVTQATALLNAFTGDSGSGGVKGLVPAPASGDAAANKYLKADGTWATVSGSGGDSVSVNGSAVTDANFTSTPAAPAGGVNVVWQTTGSGPAAVSGYLDVGSLVRGLIREPILYTDFINGGATIYGNFEAGGTAINSGTLGTTTTGLDGNHPGILNISSSTNANSGGRFNTVQTTMRVGGGERVDIIFYTPADFSTVTARFGLHDTNSSSDATDGVYLEFSGSGDLVGKTANNSTRTTSSTIATMSASTWYHGVIQVNNAASQVDFTLYSEAGSQLGTQSITTNIPTASGRECGPSIIATSSGTTSIAVLRVDFFSVAWTKALTRGQ